MVKKSILRKGCCSIPQYFCQRTTKAKDQQVFEVFWWESRTSCWSFTAFHFEQTYSPAP